MSKIISSPDAATGKTTAGKMSSKQLDNLFMNIAFDYFKSSASYFIGDICYKDGDLAKFGFIVWSNNDGESLNVENVIAGLDADCKFVRSWGLFLQNRFTKMLANKCECNYLPARNRKEALKMWVNTCFNV